MQVGNGAVVVLVSSSFLVLYISYLGTCIAEIFPSTLIVCEHLFLMCLWHGPDLTALIDKPTT
jgi:hypothetical protein